jgi:purine nucleosidase
VIMGGHVMPDRENPEYNVGADPRATQVVFGCGKPITMIGLDVTLQCRMQPEELAAIRAKDTPLSKAIMRMTELWQEAHRQGEAEQPRMPVVHDPLAVLVAADPSFVRCEAMRTEIDERGCCRKTSGPPNVDVAVEVDAERVRSTLVQLIG